MWLCGECSKWLEREHCGKPPRLAIANGFAIGEAPEDVREASIVEQSLASRVSIAHRTIVL